MLGHGGIVVFDDTVDMAQHGALRDGVLRDRVVRQVHAVPHRLDARRRGDRPHRRRRRPRAQQVTLLRDLCDTMVNGSLCAHGRHDAVPGAVARSNHFPEDFGLATADRAGRLTRRTQRPCSRPSERDSTTARPRASPTQRRSRWRSTAHAVTVPAGTSVMRAAVDAGIAGAQAVRHRQPRALRLLPPVPGRDRRPAQGYPGLVHHAGRARHEGAHADAEARTSCAAA